MNGVKSLVKLQELYNEAPFLCLFMLFYFCKEKEHNNEGKRNTWLSFPPDASSLSSVDHFNPHTCHIEGLVHLTISLHQSKHNIASSKYIFQNLSTSDLWPTSWLMKSFETLMSCWSMFLSLLPEARTREFHAKTPVLVWWPPIVLTLLQRVPSQIYSISVKCSIIINWKPSNTWMDKSNHI